MVLTVLNLKVISIMPKHSEVEAESFFHTLKGETKVGFRSKTVDISSVAFSLAAEDIRAAGCSIEEGRRR